MNRRLSAGVCTHLAIFLIVLGAKLSLIAHYSKPHPYWDSWHVEGVQLYKPFLLGTLAIADLFASASEHRPLVLRTYDLALLAFNGQWDVQLQMVVNAVLFAVLGCVLFWLLAREAGPAGRVGLAVAIAVALAVPSGWENTLNGHHAGWYFFYLFSALGIWLTLTREPLGRAWLAGYACLVLSYLSLFAGVISIATAAGGAVVRAIGQRGATRRAWMALALLAMTFAIGMAIQPRFPGQATVQASSPQAFFTALGYGLAWPHFEIGAHGLILQAPALVLGVLVLLRRLPCSSSHVYIVALAGWGWLQAAGIAFARGVHGMPPVVRYMDILTIGLLASLGAALVLVKYSGPTVLRRLPALAFLCVWIASAAVGLDRRTRDAYLGPLPEKQRAAATQDVNLRGFVASGNRAYLDGKPDADISYYGGANQLASFLTDPVIRAILPSSIREPAPVRWPGAPAHGAPPTAPGDPDGTADPTAFNTHAAAAADGVERIESEWLPAPDQPFLQFRIAGDLNQEGISLSLVTRSGEVTAVRPDTSAGDRWTTAEVRAPGEPYRILAVDNNPAGWLASSAPREMGPLSYYAKELAERGAAVSWIGYCCAALFVCLQASLLVLRRTPD